MVFYILSSLHHLRTNALLRGIIQVGKWFTPIRVDEGKGRRIGAILRGRVFTDSIAVGRLSPEMGEGSE